MKRKKGIVLGHGIKGDDKVTFKDPKTGKFYKCPYYLTWHGMITRCFSEKDKIRKPHQADSTCCDEWLYFPNFKQWVLNYEKEWGSVKGLCLDKDLIQMGNKEYHPEKCCFVTRGLNMIFSGTGKSSRNGCGVYDHNLPEGWKSFQAYIHIDNRKKSLGNYLTAQEAHKQWQLAMIEKINNAIKTLNYPPLIEGLKQRIEVLEYDYKNNLTTGKL